MIGDPHDLNMEARANGDRWGDGNSRDMHHKFNHIEKIMSPARLSFAPLLL